MKLIAVTGTPGTGKTALAKFLAQRLGFYRLDLHTYYQELVVGYNKEKKCYDLDVNKLEKLVEKKIKEKQKEKQRVILDSHLAHLLTKKLVDLVIVLVCSDLKKLKKRLEKREYSPEKVRENLD